MTRSSFLKKRTKTFCLLGGAQGEAGSRQVIAAQEQEFFVSFFKN